MKKDGLFEDLVIFSVYGYMIILFIIALVVLADG